MRRLIILLILLAASVSLGLWVMKHPGTLTLVMQPWMVEMPLWFACLSLLAVFFAFYMLMDCIDQVQFIWFRFRNWMRFRREHKLYNRTQHGLTLLIEGRWKKAERLLLAGMNESVDPLMNYLGAARAACELGAKDRQEMYLRKARAIAPHAALAIGLTQAELEISQDQLKEATLTLNQLRPLSPRHPRILSMLKKLYVRTANWQGMLELLPRLRKAKVLSATRMEQFEKNIYCEMLRNSPDKTAAEIKDIWYHMPRAVRKNPDVVAAYVQQLVRLGDDKQAEELIRKTLRSAWQPELAAMYGRLPLVNLNRQLVVAGAWLKLYGDKQPLLLTLARLCARIQLYGKAKEYFERCLSLGANREALFAYGQMLEELDEKEAAMAKYRMAAGLVV